MDRQPLVSVIITTYNRSQYLKKAIESVLSQIYYNIEIVIADNCSNDDTASMVCKYQKMDQRIVYFKNENNLGFLKNLNKGVSIAKGEYIAILDDDDFWSNSRKLEKQVKFLESNNDYVLTGGGAIWIDKNEKEIFRHLLPEKDEEIRKQILLNNCFVHSTVVFRKKDWENAGKYSEEFSPDCDWTLWLELGKLGKLYNFPEYFVYHLKWENNMSNFNIKSNLKRQIKIRKKYRKDYPGYLKSYLFGQIYYLFSFLPFQNSLKPILAKLKRMFLGGQI